jgi:hypothetical protein
MIEYVFNGFVCMANADAGDALQKTTLVDVIQRRHNVKLVDVDPSKAEVAPGIWVRYPYSNDWMSDPNTTSRDQIMSAVVWMGYAKRLDLLERQFKKQLSRGGFYQNVLPIWPKPNEPYKPWYTVDFASPEHWMQYVRSYYMITGNKLAYALYPLIALSDLFMLGNSISTYLVSKFNTEHSDDDNAVLGMIQSYDSLDTPIAWLARKIYRLRTPPGDGKYRGPWSAIKYKHRKETGAPPIGELFDYAKVAESF